MTSTRGAVVKVVVVLFGLLVLAGVGALLMWAAFLALPYLIVFILQGPGAP